MALALCTGVASAQPAYDAAIASSEAHDRAGRLEAAIDVLRAAQKVFPEDHAIALRLGWALFRAGRFGEAEQAYERAVALGRGEYEARVGLAWAKVKLGKLGEAEPMFEALVAERGADQRARDGLALCIEAHKTRASFWGALTAHRYPSHPFKSDGWGGAAGVSVMPLSRYLVAATYRGTWFAFDPALALPRTDKTSFVQHEGYATLGVGSRGLGLSAHYGLVYDGSGFSGTSHHVGLTGRASPWGDIVLAASASLYDGLTVIRTEPSWRMPLTSWLSVRPALGAQLVQKKPYAAGSLTAFGDHGAAGWWLGGKVGKEVRPAYLDVPSVYNLPESIRAGAHVGLWADAGPLRPSISYEYARLERADLLTPKNGDMHLVTVAVAHHR